MSWKRAEPLKRRTPGEAQEHFEAQLQWGRLGLQMQRAAWDAMIELGVRDGWTEAEIVDEIERKAGRGDSAPGRLKLAPAESLRERNVIAAYVRERLPAVPTPGDGLTRDRIVRTVAKLHGTEGPWPTQDVTARALGLVDARRIRQVYGRRKWKGIIADAAELLARAG